MAKAVQPYANFTIKYNEINFYSDEIFPIDSMLSDNGHESAMFLEI